MSSFVTWDAYLSPTPARMSQATATTSSLSFLFEAKAKKGLTFDQIAQAIGKDEVWVAAAFYGQAKFSTEELQKVFEVLGVSPLDAQGPMPPTDPVVYRLYESVLVYGHAIKAIIHEKFGDGIMSMIDCKVNIEKKPDPKGDRVLLTFDGKFLPYATCKWVPQKEI
ncbi:Cyanate hydratase [Hypsizygus marmoreus]|uniref:Cyanate hydratase n=1 Tax=Hypsizygus marmoreus TaxID=39966 RepID=A0A369JYF7_HYPMA|nr:Cyanate hydratase [Hypsizygus marmoreus]